MASRRAVPLRHRSPAGPSPGSLFGSPPRRARAAPTGRSARPWQAGRRSSPARGGLPITTSRADVLRLNDGSASPAPDSTAVHGDKCRVELSAAQASGSWTRRSVLRPAPRNPFNAATSVPRSRPRRRRTRRLTDRPARRHRRARRAHPGPARPGPSAPENLRGRRAGGHRATSSTADPRRGPAADDGGDARWDSVSSTAAGSPMRTVRVTRTPGATLRARRPASARPASAEPCPRIPPGSQGGTPGATRPTGQPQAYASRNSTPMRSASRAADSTAARLVAEPSTPTSTGPLMTAPPSQLAGLRTGAAPVPGAIPGVPGLSRPLRPAALSRSLTPRCRRAAPADRGRAVPAAHRPALPDSLRSAGGEW